MTPDTADLVLYLITGVACVVWMIAFRCLWRLNHPLAAVVPAGGDSDRYEVSHDTAEPLAEAENELICVASGKTEIAANYDQLSLRLARQIAQKMPAARIVSQSPQAIVLEPIGFGNWMGFARVDIALSPMGDQRTEISHQVWQQRSQAPAWAWWLSGIGIVVIVVGYALIKTLVVNHPNPAVRWQTVQMVQVIHFLWPPFLAVAFAKARTTAAEAMAGMLDGVITNLPYVDGPAVAPS